MPLLDSEVDKRFSLLVELQMVLFESREFTERFCGDECRVDDGEDAAHRWVAVLSHLIKILIF